MADLSTLIKDELAPAVNEHDINRVLQCFDDNATVNFSVAPPGFSTTLKGKTEIRRFFETMLPGMHVEPINFKTSGDHVEWSATLSSDMLRKSGLKDVHVKNSATIRNNKIVSFNPELPPNVGQQLYQGTQTQGTRPTTQR